MDINHVDVVTSHNPFNYVNRSNFSRQMTVFLVAPLQIGTEDFGGSRLLGAPGLCVTVASAIREDKHGYRVSCRLVGQERASTPDLDVVGVGADGEHVHSVAPLASPGRI